ncbi:MAG TPA: GAF domain-containing protein [Anaerolinea sp.]|nr:GAF domain-containing protein [Anaerolinea sp.]
MLNKLKSFLPKNPPPEVRARGSLATIREQILQTLLLSLLALAAPVIVLAVRSEIRAAKWGLAFFYIAMFMMLLLATLNRKWPYMLRSMAMIGLTYLLAVSEFFDSSLPGEMRFYLAIFTTLTASLLGMRAGIVATVVGFLTILVTHLAVVNNIIVLHDPDLFYRSPDWVNGLFTYLLLTGAVSLSIAALANGLQTGLKEKEDLANNLEKQRNILDETVQSRTADIQRRLIQVRTAAEISRAISRLNDPTTIFRQVVDLVCERFDLYYVGLFMLDPTGRFAVLRAGTGEAGKAMLDQGHRLAVGGNSMIGWCTANRQPRIALDVGEEAVRFSNPFLPRTRSEIALPILSHTNILGALTVQSDRSRAFDQNDIMVLQGIADSLAVAIENTNLFVELNQNLEEIRTLNRNYIHQAWTDVITETGELSFAYQGNEPRTASKAAKAAQYPLTLRGQVIGYVNLETEDGSLSEDDQAFLEALTAQTAMALENARLVQESEWRVFQEKKLNEMTTDFHRAANLDSILKAAVEHLGQLPSVSEVSIQLIAPDGQANPVPGGNGKEGAA